MKANRILLLALVLSFELAAGDETPRRTCGQVIADFFQGLETEFAKMDTWNLVFTPKERQAVLDREKARRAADNRTAYGSNANPNGTHGDTTYGATGHADAQGGGVHGDTGYGGSGGVGGLSGGLGGTSGSAGNGEGAGGGDAGYF